MPLRHWLWRFCCAPLLCLLLCPGGARSFRHSPPHTVAGSTPTPRRVLLLSAEPPGECSSVTGQWLQSRAARSRQAYASRHGWRLLLTNAKLTPDNLPAVSNKGYLLDRLLGGAASDLDPEWIVWVDSDTVMVDTGFVPPWDKYDRQRQHVVLWGEPSMWQPGGQPEYAKVSTGVILLRVSVWTRMLVARWVQTGADPRAQAEQAYLLHGDRLHADDQSALLHLLVSDPSLRRHVLFENNYVLTGHYREYRAHFSVARPSTIDPPVWGNTNLPWIVHWSGCQLCSGKSPQIWAECSTSMVEVLNLVENVELERFGIQFADLQNSTLMQKVDK